MQGVGRCSRIGRKTFAANLPNALRFSVEVCTSMATVADLGATKSALTKGPRHSGQRYSSAQRGWSAAPHRTRHAGRAAEPVETAGVDLKDAEGSVLELLVRGFVIIDRLLVTNWDSARWLLVIVIGLAAGVAVGILGRP